jgi:hypothetical protein
MKEMKKEKASFLLRVAPRPNNALNCRDASFLPWFATHPNGAQKEAAYPGLEE